MSKPDTRTLNAKGEHLVARILEWLLHRERWQKRAIFFALDVLMAVIAIYTAFSLRLGYWQFTTPPVLKAIAATLTIFPPIFFLVGVYRNIFRFSGSGTMVQLGAAIGALAIPLIVIFTIFTVDRVPRTVAFLVPILFFMLAATCRITARYMLVDLFGMNRRGGQAKRALVYGAGSSGRQLASSLKMDHNFRFVAFMDDDERLDGQRLDGVPVHHAANLPGLIELLRIDTVFLAIPRAENRRRREIIANLSGYGVHVQTLPSVIELVDGDVSVDDIRELRVEDLLGRDPVQPDAMLMERTIVGRTVLVTGAGGSIGSELCRQIAEVRPDRLILAEVSEPSLYQIDREIRQLRERLGAQFEIVPELINTANVHSVRRLFARFRPNTVFHAAAYKHVPLVEANRLSGMANNIFGTLNCAQAAAAAGTEYFILISTDKAVRPTNVMGASKRACEMVLQALAEQSDGTRFSMVRFGNVLGSSGSVVPQFERQIRSGGPVTLTHRDITRYFMTIPEAAQLVIQAGAMAQGGEVFLLDMGAPIRIHDLARTMIELSGRTLRDDNNPDGDIEIREIGLRPGEKLYEELLIDSESKPTGHIKIMQARERWLPKDRLIPALEALAAAVSDGDVDAAMAILSELVPEYTNSAALPASSPPA